MNDVIILNYIIDDVQSFTEFFSHPEHAGKFDNQKESVGKLEKGVKGNLYGSKGNNIVLDWGG